MPAPKMPAITALADFTESINMLVYGDPGAGKTVLAGTCPDALIVGCEPGTISAARFGSSAETIQCRDYSEFAGFLNWARKSDEAKKYRWFAIDSGTAMQELVWQEILRAGHEANKARDLDTAQIQDYGKVQNMFKRIIKAINDLPQNILYTAHTLRTEDEEGDEIVMPMFSGKNGTDDPTTMSQWVQGTVHTFGYLKVKQGDDGEYRRLICKRSGPYYGKDRYGALTPYVDNPNMAEIEKLILSSGKPTTTRPARHTNTERTA